ncbi:MAG: hypothetical protein ACREDR_04240, partial [Blastocatellia bacterium]
MNMTMLFDRHRRVLEREVHSVEGLRTVGWYAPLSREIFIDQPPVAEPIKGLPFVASVLPMIPPESLGYFWHEFTHHLQFVATAQGLRSMFSVCDELSCVDAIVQICRRSGVHIQPPLRDHLSEIENELPELAGLIRSLRASEARRRYVLGRVPEPVPVSVGLRANRDPARVDRNVIVTADGLESFVQVRLSDGTPALFPMDVRSLREGMAVFVEHAVNLNAVLAGNEADIREYWQRLHQETQDDRLLTYYVCYLWWRRCVGKVHESFSTFLALCELASMYDAVINAYPLKSAAAKVEAPRLPHAGYFHLLTTALAKAADSIEPISEGDSSIFVEALLREVGWPDLR